MSVTTQKSHKRAVRAKSAAPAIAQSLTPDAGRMGFGIRGPIHSLEIALSGMPSSFVLASEVSDVIRKFHSHVASPLASIGLQLEVLRMDDSTGDSARVEIDRITRSLDEVIDVIRNASRSLREVEKQIRAHEPSESAGRSCT